MSGLKRTVVILVCLAAVAMISRSAHAKLLLESQVQVGDAIVFEDSDPRSGQCYYMPNRPKLAAWKDNIPKLSFVKYIKSGSNELKGGILHVVVKLGLEEDEISTLRQKLSKGGISRAGFLQKKLGGSAINCRNLGPVIFRKGQFVVVSAAAGEGGVFTRQIIGQGNAPLIAGSEASVSIAVTKEGAAFLDKTMELDTYPLNIRFDMTYEGLTPQYEAHAYINWDKIRNYFERESRVAIYKKYERSILGVLKWVYYVKVGERQEIEMTDFLQSNAMITVEKVGQDENMDAILQTMTEQVMRSMTESVLDLPQSQSEKESAARSDDDAKKDGGQIPYGTRMKRKNITRRGRASIHLKSSLSEERETGPMELSLGGTLRQHKKNSRIFQVVDLDDPDLEDRTVFVSLDIEDAGAFKDYINYATVSFKKGTKTGDLIFNRQEFEQSGNFLSWTYPRLGEPTEQFERYQYRVDWSFAGGVKVNTPWQTSIEPRISIAPPHKLRTLDLMIDSDNAEQYGVRYISVHIKNAMLGKERVREVKVIPTENPLAKYSYYHKENDLDYSYNITWRLKDKKEPVSTGWRDATDSFIDLNYSGE